MIEDPRPAVLGVCAAGRSPTVNDIVGTAFGVSEHVAITAFHLIGDRSTGEIVSDEVNVYIGNGDFITAIVSDPHRDLDAAVLELCKPLPSHLIPLSLTARAEPLLPFQSPGWPSIRPFARFETALSGHLVASVQIFHGAPALQLYCNQAATQSLHGFSGAPVVINKGGQWAAVGIVRWNQPQEDHSDLAIGGTVYATPIAALLERSNSLAEASQIIDSESPSGFCVAHSKADVPIAAWVGSVLRKAGYAAMVRAEYIRPGDNFPSKLADAHRQHPNSIIVCSSTTLTCDSPSHHEELRILASREYGGSILPIRTVSATLPAICATIEPIDLFNSLTDDQATAMIVNALNRPETFACPVPASLAKIVDEYPELLVRSRLSRASFDAPPTLGGVV